MLFLVIYAFLSKKKYKKNIGSVDFSITLSQSFLSLSSNSAFLVYIYISVYLQKILFSVHRYPLSEMKLTVRAPACPCLTFHKVVFILFLVFSNVFKYIFLHSVGCCIYCLESFLSDVMLFIICLFFSFILFLYPKV